MVEDAGLRLSGSPVIELEKYQNIKEQGRPLLCYLDYSCLLIRKHRRHLFARKSTLFRAGLLRYLILLSLSPGKANL